MRVPFLLSIFRDRKIFLFFVISFVLRFVYVKIFFNFLTTDEAYYIYWFKIYFNEYKDLPLVASQRHFSFSLNVPVLLPLYVILKIFGVSENYALFLSAKISGLIISFLVSLVIYFILISWVRKEIAVALTFFPSITFLDWTAQFRGYDLVFYLICLGFLFIQRRRGFLSGFCISLATSVVPVTVYFSLTLIFFLVFNRFRVRDYLRFFGGAVLGFSPLILYNACNADMFNKVSKFILTGIPTLDEFVLRIKGWEGWINFQCGVNYLLEFDRLKILTNIVAISLPYKKLLFLSLFFYVPAFVFSLFLSFLHRNKKIPFIFLFAIIFLYFFSPQDRNMVYAILPFLFILAFGLDYLSGITALRNLYKIMLIVFPLHNLSYAFFNTKDCSGYYMNFEDGRNLQVKNFSCKKSGFEEFQKLYNILKENGINFVFSDFIVAPIINALFYPDIKASSQLFLSLDWMPEITYHIYQNYKEGKISFVFSKESMTHNYLSSQIDSKLSERGVHFKKREVDGLIIYYDFSPNVLPDDLWNSYINSLRNCFSNTWGFERRTLYCIKKLISLRGD